MRHRRYNTVAEYIPGNLLLVPDALFSNPMYQTNCTTKEDIKMYMNCTVKTHQQLVEN